MTNDQAAVDALISAFDSLTGLLYTVATEDGLPLPDDTQREAAIALADRTEQQALDLLPTEYQPGVADSEEPLRDGLFLISSVARQLGQGEIIRSRAARTLFEVIEELETHIDLRWLAGAASARVRKLLPSTAALIGELVARDSGDTAIAPPMDFRPGDATNAATLTLLLSDRAREEGPEGALGDLHAAGVPYSMVEPAGEDGIGYETLWLPGMTKPLRRSVLGAGANGGATPILTWQDHAALLAAADETAAYTELVAAYLGANLRDVDNDAEVDVLSRIAEAIERGR
jgi:hypothetical protein